MTDEQRSTAEIVFFVLVGASYLAWLILEHRKPCGCKDHADELVDEQLASPELEAAVEQVFDPGGTL